MQLKPARKGGKFFGCTQWPDCNGSRDPINKRPGPVAQVRNARKHFGEAVWAKMEKEKCNGTFTRLPTPAPNVYNKCWYCRMDPCDHMGRDGPMDRGH